MGDAFDGQTTLTSQAKTWSNGVITPSDDPEDNWDMPKAIHIAEGAGTFYAVDVNGNVGRFYGVAGDYPPIRPIRINATGLTAGLKFELLTS
jgi:hypothetical protein